MTNPKKKIIISLVTLLVIIALAALIMFILKTYKGKSHDDSSFGSYNNIEIKKSELTPPEKRKLYEAEKKLYEVGEEIVIHRYLKSFFEDYQKANNLKSLEESQSHFFSNHTKVDESEVNLFLEKNRDNSALKQLKTDAQRKDLIRRHLQSLNQQKALQSQVSKAKDQGLIQLSSNKPEAPVLVIPESEYSYGPKNAKVVVTKFADYQCTHCATTAELMSKLKEEFKDKVRYDYFDFPLMQIHPEAFSASVAARCAHNQGKFWEMHEKIFEKAEKEGLSSKTYTSLAKNLKLDMNKFHECLRDPKEAEYVNKGLQIGMDAGVSATPSLFINGKKYEGRITYDDLKNAIETALKGA